MTAEGEIMNIEISLKEINGKEVPAVTQRAVKPRPSGRGYKAHLNWNFCL